MIPADRDERTRALDPGDDSRVIRAWRLAPGAVFARRYHVVAPLGSGGSGEVYQVRDAVSGLSLALKVLYPYPGQDDLERLRRELRLVRRIEHPGIVRIHDIGEADGHLYTVSDLLIGETLRERLTRAGRLDVPEAFAILRGALEALSMAHSQGVVHRDIKPANIFLVSAAANGEGAEGGQRGERVVLLDFGLAREAGGEGLTTIGRFLGTPEYASPEQALGDAAPTPATDVYACGITLWHMLAGAPPYVRDTDFATLLAHTREPLPPMPDVPVRVRALLAAMLAKEPDARPQDARAVLRRLDDHGLATTVRALLGSPLRRYRARPAAAGLTVAGVCLANIALAALAWPRSVDLHDGNPTWRAAVSVLDLPIDVEPATIQVAKLVPGALPPRALLLDAGPSLAASASNPGVSTWGPVLHEVEWPGMAPYALDAKITGDLLFGARPPHYKDRYAPAHLAPMASERFRALVVYVQLAGFATKLVLVSAANTESSTVHYGHTNDIQIAAGQEGERDAAIVLARNNVLGPRFVLFQRPFDHDQAETQYPPYLLDPAFSPPSAGWYVPLGVWAPGDGETRVVIKGDVVEAIWSGARTPARFALKTGVPLEAALRGGLECDAWIERREGLWRALRDAAARSFEGRPADAAERLESYAEETPRVAEFAGIAFYRAALARLAAAKGTDTTESERALDDVRRARSLEAPHAPPRYTLLEAEILARLQRREEARELASAWGRESEHEMYVLEWALVHVMLGESPPARFSDDTPLNGPFDVWRELVRLSSTERNTAVNSSAGDLRREVDALGARIARAKRVSIGALDETIWHVHLDLAAHMSLALDPPDPTRALELLGVRESTFQAGTPEICELARVRAQVLLENRAPTDREIESAETTARDLEEWGATDLVALYTARRAWLDVAWLAERAGDRARAARARERARSSFPDPIPSAVP